MKFLSIFLMLFILLASISCVMAYDYNFKNIPCALNDYYNNFDNTFNHLNTSSMNLHNYIINNHNLSPVIDNNTSIKKLENTTNNLTNESNISLINKSIDLKLGNYSVINSTNIHFNTSNSLNLTVDKNKHSKVLFNNASSHQIKNNIIDNQFNKSFKLLGLNNISYGNNTTIVKKVNITSDNITVVNKINNHELSKFNNTTD
ncbi:MAG: hypothetical protein MJ224_05310, partial [archaeon]|nr:hypothetical protein [archaeon]